MPETETLADRLAGGKTLDPPEARRLARDLGNALLRAHDAGLVHGHLEPGKVVFDEDGTAQLSGLRATPPPVPEGAPAPSQLGDQRALAAILYLALTGTPALGEDLRAVSELRKDVPRALDTVLMRGLAPEPTTRYPDVASFARAFESAFERLASPSRVTLALAALGPLAVVGVGVLWALSGGGKEPAPPQRLPAHSAPHSPDAGVP